MGVVKLLTGSSDVCSPTFELRAYFLAFTKCKFQFLGVFVTLQYFAPVSILWSLLETLS